MAGSVNKVILIGNLGKEPEVRSMQNGGKVCTLRIATSETWKDRNGERQERVQWHQVVIFNEALIGVAERFLKKGSKVYIEGQLETRKWTDQSGVERYTTEVVLRPYRGEITLLGDPQGSRDGGQGGNGGGYEGGYGSGNGGSGHSYSYGNYGGSSHGSLTNSGTLGSGPRGSYSGGGGKPSDELDDEVPF
ncbi:single-stranded DNA-binding protein [Nitrospirillum amazonense]|uniref:single-stranded DNA-binding protein n=1 Tax=Nitrospirillum amazonense TaxID=28077 RepID=UPI0024126266|nr:single-stranded DNA-binding protein [Nitrospirillum amazonense]MDG3443719.1 single-stranded DNA-binding protein [Nitrospirillum amazonense]